MTTARAIALVSAGPSRRASATQAVRRRIPPESRLGVVDLEGRRGLRAREHHRTLFHGRVETAAKVGAHDAIRPSIGGWARIIGHNTIFVDPRDPLALGFQLA